MGTCDPYADAYSSRKKNHGGKEGSSIEGN
ncbi:unnamed protein product, partial [Vitis vinifera]